MAGRFVLKTAKDGQFYFNLKAGNGETVLMSEMYQAREGALNGIESVKKNAPQDERFEKKTTEKGKFYFVLKAANHQVIGQSEMYDTEASRDNGIAAVQRAAEGAELVDEAGA